METYQKRKKFPSQIKYETNNPTITFRMKKHEKTKIRDMVKKSGKSISELIRIALLDLEKDYSEIMDKSYDNGFKDGCSYGEKEGYNKGYEIGNNDGYNKGKKDWAVWG